MPSIFGLHNDGYHNIDDFSQKMFESSAIRGGDAQAIHRNDQFLMGVRGGAAYAQASLVMNPVKTLIAAIDGEIYNCAELRQLLGNDAIKTWNDAILPLYEKFGQEFPKYLNGIFALALWDAQTRTLYLIRDHLGSRSLFYARKGDNLFFASTLRAILNTGEIAREITLSGLHAYFSSTAICAPDTLFRDIFCVRPGAMAIYHNGTLSEYQYWQSQTLREDDTRSEAEWIERTRELILDAITIRAKEGETYGSLVSGGVDTSIIAATLATRFHSAQHKLPVFSIAFEEVFYNDAPLQQIMYQQYPLEPHSATLHPQEFADILQKGAAALDKPVNDNALVGMYKAFGLAKQAGCSAVFDGEAADELFFTGHAHGEKAFQKYLFLPFWLRKLVLGTLFPSIPIGDSLWNKGCRLFYKIGLSNDDRILTRLPCFYNHATPILRDYAAVAKVDPLMIGKKYLTESALREPLNRYHYGITKTFLADDLLFKNERMASAHGLINRTPFVDYRLVELAFRIPERFKLTAPTDKDDGTKQVYKKAIQGLIPDAILHRKKKRGFSQPSSVWYRRELKDFVHDTLLSQSALCLNYVNKGYLTHFISEHTSGKANFDYLISSVLILELWLQAYVKNV